MDGLAAVTYDSASNRMFSTNDASAVTARYRHDAAGRLTVASNDAGAPLESYAYGEGRRRLMSKDFTAGVKKYYVRDGNLVIAEYTEEANPTPHLQWRTSAVF